jgi:predicted outer membrane protein
MTKTSISAAAAALALGLAGVATAAPPPSPPPRSDPAQPSANPADPTPPTGSVPQLNKGRVPGAGGSSKPTAVPSDPGSTAGILNEKDVPGKIPAPTTKEAKTAQRAVQELHKANALEIALGALARDKASAEAVRDYGRELVDAHQASDKKLLEYATAHGFALDQATPVTAERETPPALGSEHVPGAAMPMGDRAGTDTRPGAAGTGTGNPGSGTVAGTVTSPSTTGTSPAPSSTGSAPAAAAAPERTGLANDANMPSELDTEGRRTLARLQKLEGDKFDKQFLTTMVRGHTKVLGQIKAYEKQEKSGDLVTLLSDTRHMVEQHLDRAKALQRTGSSDAAKPGGKTLGAL